MPRYAERAARPPAKAPVRGAGPRRQPLPQRPPLWHVLQRRAAEKVRAETKPAAAPSRDGLPAPLKAGIEHLSGLAMDDVRVHHNSAAPAKLGALAYTKGADIHLGPGQERHLPHEAWHVVQQKQGRVRANVQLRGLGVNNDEALEAEADRMGAAAGLAGHAAETGPQSPADAPATPVVQGKFGFELEMRVLVSKRGPPVDPAPADADDLEESRYDDPKMAGLYVGPDFDVVVDHGNGISDFVGKSGHSRRNNTAILEIVTHEQDEYALSEDAAVAPMIEAAAFAGRVKTLTNNFTTRELLNAQPVNLADVYVGQRRFPGDIAWQTTDAQVQATYAVKLSRAADLAALGKTGTEQVPTPLDVNQYSIMQNQAKALADGAAKANALITVLKVLANAEVAAGRLTAAQLQPAALADLKGLLTLAGTYLVAGRIDQNEGLDKNMVPLLLRHELTDAHALLSNETRTVLQNAAVRTILRDKLLSLTERNSGDKLFPGPADKARRATNPDTNVAQPTCGAWIDAILTGAAAPLQGWFGKSKVVAPEAVGPTGGARPLGVVMEQRSVKTREDSEAGVPAAVVEAPAAGWEALARRYYKMLRALNA